LGTTRDTDTYFTKRGFVVKIDPVQVIALYRGQRGIGRAAYEKYIHDTELRHAPWKTTIMEPIIIDADLTQKHPFGTSITPSIQTEIESAIAKQLSLLGDLSRKIANFHHRKLIVNDVALRKKHKRDQRSFYRDKLYALWRWNVAKRIAESLKEFNVTLSEVLALYQTEGDLNIPLSLDALHWQLEPSPLIKRNKAGKYVLYEPYGSIAEIYHGRHQTFHVQKNKEKASELFLAEMSTVIKSRSYFLNNLEKRYFYPSTTPSMILSTGKENANQYYLSALAGLDFYMHNIFPARINSGELRQLLTYQYARYFIKAGSETPFKELRQQADEIYNQMCAVTPQSIKKGEVWTNSIICTILRTGIREKDENNRLHEFLDHHLFPVNPVDYVAFIVLLGVIRLVAFRNDALIIGGMRFNGERGGEGNGRYNPLPLSLAYIRYNMWDIHFAVIVLDALYKVLHKTPINNQTPQYLRRLYTKLKPFRRKANPTVWTVLDNWFKKNYYLRSKEVTKRKKIRNAIYEDAKSDQLYASGDPGDNEKAAIKKLNEDGLANTAIPLLDSLTTNELWDDLNTAIYSHRMLRSNLKYKHHLKDYKNRFIKNHSIFKQFDE
jgi:hypothetical protein